MNLRGFPLLSVNIQNVCIKHNFKNTSLYQNFLYFKSIFKCFYIRILLRRRVFHKFPTFFYRKHCYFIFSKILCSQPAFSSNIFTSSFMLNISIPKYLLKNICNISFKAFLYGKIIFYIFIKTILCNLYTVHQLPEYFYQLILGFPSPRHIHHILQP